MHRFHARRAGRADVTTSFLTLPEPRSIGLPERGQQLVLGQFLFSGHLVEAKDAAIWDIGSDRRGVTAEIQGCVWLDDLAALGDEHARAKAQAWVTDWIARYGSGRGPGWTPQLTGQRLTRWINHGAFLTHGLPDAETDRVFQSLARQTLFVSRRWRTAPPGLPMFETLTGLIHAGVILQSMAPHIPEAAHALATHCQEVIDAQGGIPERNPEMLLTIFSHLIWCREILDRSGHTPPLMLERAISRIAPTLRALRHTDGTLARFHGGGKGIAGRLDAALFNSGNTAQPEPGVQMGYARVTGGRTSLIADAAIPPKGEASEDGHASTLAIELTSGRRPMIVSCGSGARLGSDWRRASRATPSHSTLGLGGVSSSHLTERARGPKGAELLRETPKLVRVEFSQDLDWRKLEISHDGYQQTHGLTHARILQLSVDGRHLQGEDVLATLTPADQHRFDKALKTADGDGIPYDIRFHLHPDVAAEIDTRGSVVSLTLKSGEVWTLRMRGDVEMRLMPSVYLEMGRLKPRQTQQVVLSGRAIAYGTRVRWSIAKAQDTPTAVRDLAEADPLGMS
ncbi:MAG: heparinase II/III family protein [Pseudomonadota bacterium]